MIERNEIDEAELSKKAQAEYLEERLKAKPNRVERRRKIKLLNKQKKAIRNDIFIEDVLVPLLLEEEVKSLQEIVNRLEFIDRLDAKGEKKTFVIANDDEARQFQSRKLKCIKRLIDVLPKEFLAKYNLEKPKVVTKKVKAKKNDTL